MLQNPSLGAPAFEYIHYSMEYTFGLGWSVVAIGRRCGATEYEREFYGDLDTAEAGELLTVLVDRALGL